MRGFRSDRAQAMVEFMFAFPIFMILVLMLIEFGFAFFTYVTVNNTASEAARFAAVGALPSSNCPPAAGTIDARAVEISSGVVQCGDVSVTYEKVGGAEPIYVRGDGVAVRIAYTYTPITPLGDLMNALSFGALPATFTMHACSDSRLEAQPGAQATPLPGGVNCNG